MQLTVRTGLELVASKFEVQRSNYSATLPPLCTSCILFQTLVHAW